MVDRNHWVANTGNYCFFSMNELMNEYDDDDDDAAGGGGGDDDDG